MRSALRPLLLVGVAAVVLAGCARNIDEIEAAEGLACPTGSDCYDPPLPEGPGGQLRVEAGEFFFTLPPDPQVFEGDLAVTLDNIGEAEHTFTIEELDVEAEAHGGETAEASFTAPDSGSYEFFCEYHPDQMSGTFAILGSGEDNQTDTEEPTKDKPEGDETGGGKQY